MDAQDDRGPPQDDAFCSNGCISLTSLGMAGISGGFASVAYEQCMQPAHLNPKFKAAKKLI